MFVSQVSERRSADCLLDSFVDRDMLVRHFGHGIGHLKFERQQEVGTTRVSRGDDDGNNDADDTDESEDSDSGREEDSESESAPDIRAGSESEGDNDNIEESESYSTCNSEDDDGGYASL